MVDVDYTPHSQEEIQEMLDFIGIKSLSSLFDTIPKELLLDQASIQETSKSSFLNRKGLTEIGLYRHLKSIGKQNKIYKAVFQGAGCYNHYIPAIVDFIASRSEFWTAYTPYQAEISQGFLQVIFEYQSLIANLTGMNYSNASLHDGATALADAITMAKSQHRKRNTIVIIGEMNPLYKETLDTSFLARDYKFKQVKVEDIRSSIDEEVMAVVINSPDFLGTVHDVKQIVNLVKNIDKKIILIQSITEILSLALLSPPGENGVDIAVGEAQSLGIPMQFGGPLLGFIAVNSVKLLHKIPGRIVGVTKEERGDNYGFTLTLQAREQHIRRERALSNICSNEALNMLRAVVYMVALGRTGLKNLAKINVRKAGYLKTKLLKMNDVRVINEINTFNEFTIQLNPLKIKGILKRCEEENILGPLDLGMFDDEWNGNLLICVTEMCEIESLDLLIKIITEEVAKT